LIYVFNALKIGTEEEMEHLKWVSENVPKDKVIFVINKLDDFKIADDRISDTINGVRSDLSKYGYKNPLVCPLSAKLALLIKQKESHESMSDDDTDEYDHLIKKFNKPDYDLSSYYDGVKINDTDIETLKIAKKCGIYGFENLIFGGKIK